MWYLGNIEISKARVPSIEIRNIFGLIESGKIIMPTCHESVRPWNESCIFVFQQVFRIRFRLQTHIPPAHRAHISRFRAKMPFKQIHHQFNSPQLDYTSMPNYQPCIKVSVFFSKIDSIDHDTFFGHWQTVHADLATATQAFKDHIVRYAQVSSLAEFKRRL